MKLKSSLSIDQVVKSVKRHNMKIVFLILMLGIAYTLFFLYQNLYLPISEKQPIDPTLIQSKKEVINQKLYDTVYQNMTAKTTKINIDLGNINNPFLSD